MPDGCKFECVMKYLFFDWQVEFRYNGIRRNEIRERYKIKGGILGDFITSCYCMCCALVQQERQVNFEEARVVNQQYQKTENMELDKKVGRAEG